MLTTEDNNLTDAQNELYAWIKNYMRDFQHSPSIRQMMQAMGLKSPAPIQSRLKHLQEKGFISWQEGKARTMQIVDEIIEGVPIMGSVAAGGLIETYTDVQENLDISDVLEMTVEQAAETFSAIPQASDRLSTLVDVGLGYVKLGQPAPTLSGGEAQRVKLATELSKRATGKTLYLIDEPTTGLSFYDVHKLMDVIQRLVDKGNSVIVIEHNLDVIRCSDWIIDLGPDGGDKGGEIIAEGIPEDVAKNPTSYTAKYLKKVLK